MCDICGEKATSVWLCTHVSSTFLCSKRMANPASLRSTKRTAFSTRQSTTTCRATTTFHWCVFPVSPRVMFGLRRWIWARPFTPRPSSSLCAAHDRRSAWPRSSRTTCNCKPQCVATSQLTRTDSALRTTCTAHRRAFSASTPAASRASACRWTRFAT